MTTQDPGATPINNLQAQAWNLALHAFGTAWVFERRAKKYGRRLRCLAFLGLAVPVTLGAVVGSFGAKVSIFPVLLAIGSFLAVVQAVLSLWSLVAKWDNSLGYSWESQVDNIRLFKRFEELAVSMPGEAEFKLRMQLLQLENDARDRQDIREEITDAEKRAGMRAGLRQLRKACVNCKEIPSSMRPTKCDICGNF